MSPSCFLHHYRSRCQTMRDLMQAKCYRRDGSSHNYRLSLSYLWDGIKNTFHADSLGAGLREANKKRELERTLAVWLETDVIVVVLYGIWQVDGLFDVVCEGCCHGERGRLCEDVWINLSEQNLKYEAESCFLTFLMKKKMTIISLLFYSTCTYLLLIQNTNS